MNRSATLKLFAVPEFRGWWIAGGLANAMLWFEILAAGLFTFKVTGSGFAVALVLAARSLPLLVLGAFIGVLSDAINRKRIVVGGLCLTAISSTAVGTLGMVGWLQPWHLGVAALVSGTTYATEFPARRRMIVECVSEEARPHAVAIDSLTGYVTRCAGPLVGGFVYQGLGVAGAFFVSALCSAIALLVVWHISYVQATLRQLPIRRALADLREAFEFARASRTLVAILSVTIITNLFGYSYSALVAPLGVEVFRLSSAMVGALAAIDPAGALVAGLLMAAWTPRGRPLVWFCAGAVGLFVALLAVSIVGWFASSHAFWLVMGVLFAGGFASAAYTVFQTTMVIDATPAHLRGRMMGLLTLCIGTWPLGTVIAGALSRAFGPLGAIGTLGGCGLAGMGVIALVSFKVLLRYPKVI
jgi:MFS family permease